jgi:hypothetical protein
MPVLSRHQGADRAGRLIWRLSLLVFKPCGMIRLTYRRANGKKQKPLFAAQIADFQCCRRMIDEIQLKSN